MGKISDEIRNDFVRGDGVDVVSYRKLLSIADRIDSEMMELPKDADGVPIHVGDTVYLENGLIAIVDIVEFIQDFGVRIKCFNSKYGYANRSPEEVAHERHDSLESIANELEAWCDGADVDGDACEKPRDLADRIRRLAKEGER